MKISSRNSLTKKQVINKWFVPEIKQNYQSEEVRKEATSQLPQQYLDSMNSMECDNQIQQREVFSLL